MLEIKWRRRVSISVRFWTLSFVSIDCTDSVDSRAAPARSFSLNLLGTCLVSSSTLSLEGFFPSEHAIRAAKLDMHGTGDKMPLRFAHMHSKRTSGGPADEMYDSKRKDSIATRDSIDYLVSSTVSGHLIEDGPMEGVSPTNAAISHVQRPISAASYSKFDLLHHLHRISRNNTSVISALGDVYLQRKELTVPTLFSLDASPVATGGFPSCEVYDVDSDCLALRQRQGQDDDYDDPNESSCMWNMIKVRIEIKNAPVVTQYIELSASGCKYRWRRNRKDHVSETANFNHHRIITLTDDIIRILHQPSPTAFAGIHLTMEHNFDMDLLLSYIVSDETAKKGRTSSYVRKTVEPRPFHQRTFLFVFKYYTIVNEGFEPAHWQRHGYTTSDRVPTDHLDISECSSVVGLSLERQSFSPASQHNDTTEHFLPFHVLNIRCFPDNIRSQYDFDQQVCYSGPYAFLHCLTDEYQNAAQRFKRLNESIEKLALPSVRQGSYLSVSLNFSSVRC